MQGKKGTLRKLDVSTLKEEIEPDDSQEINEEMKQTLDVEIERETPQHFYNGSRQQQNPFQVLEITDLYDESIDQLTQSLN